MAALPGVTRCPRRCGDATRRTWLLRVGWRRRRQSCVPRCPVPAATRRTCSCASDGGSAGSRVCLGARSLRPLGGPGSCASDGGSAGSRVCLGARSLRLLGEPGSCATDRDGAGMPRCPRPCAHAADLALRGGWRPPVPASVRPSADPAPARRMTGPDAPILSQCPLRAATGLSVTLPPPRHHATTPPRHHATTPPRHYATTPPRHPATLPPCHPATLPPATLPPCHPAALPRCHPATLPRCHAATLPPRHPATLPPPPRGARGRRQNQTRNPA
jgi:hypothetical protein